MQSCRALRSTAPLCLQRAPGIARDPHSFSPLGKTEVNGSVFIHPELFSWFSVRCLSTAHGNVWTFPVCLLIFSELVFQGLCFQTLGIKKDFLPYHMYFYILFNLIPILDSCCLYGLSCNPKRVEIPHHILYDLYLRTWRVEESTDIHLIICSFAQVKAKHDNWKS